MNLNNIGIRTRIAAGLAFILVLAVLSAANSFYQNISVKYEAGEVALSWIPAIDNLGKMKGYLSEHYLDVNDHTNGGGDAVGTAFAKKLQELESKLANSTEIYAATLLTYNAESAAQGDAEKALYASYQSKRDAYFALTKAGLSNYDGANGAREAMELVRQDFASRVPPAFREANSAMEAILQFNLDGTARAATTVTDKVAAAEQAQLLAVIVIVIVSLGLIWAIPRSVLKPIEEAVAMARSITDGDLTRKVNTYGKDEPAVLLGHLQSMQSRLAEVVSQVRQGSESVATASAEIAQGNNDLSARTENQASALEQTAASMEELSSTVKQNADNARQANQLAMSASSVAQQGGKVVDQVIDTMKGINDSSRKIADIISVIDGIAFQTNILALNAAVEAARAGEQGRGFAVVASEVRSLAGRSAAAAKEIKALIDDSVRRVETGTALVDQAGTTMQEVVNAIRRVTDIMGEISAASNEQSLGVSQVGEAVTQMDQVTQQNAALVEEMAAAASSLKSQAQELVQIVAVFKLGAGDATQIALPRSRVRAYPSKAGNVKGAQHPATVSHAKPKANVTGSAAPTQLAAPVPKLTTQASGSNSGDWETF